MGGRLFLSAGWAESERGSRQDRGGILGGCRWGGGSGGRDTCGRDQGRGGGGQTQAEPNGAGEGARPALQHLRLLLKLPHPTSVKPGLQQPAAPPETAVLATAGEGSKGGLLLETPVPTSTPLHAASQVALVVKNPPAKAGDIKRCGFDFWVGKMPWRRKWPPTPVFLSGESHGQRSLVGYSSWGRRESDTTKAT